MMRLSGRLRSSVIIGLQGIRARKLRTFLSMMSLFLGVLAVVTVQAGAEIAKRALLADIELQEGKDGTLQIYLPPNRGAPAVALDTLRGQLDGVATISTTAIIGEPGVLPINRGGSPFDKSGKNAKYDQGQGRSYLQCDSNGTCTIIERSGNNAPRGMAIELKLTAMTGDIRQFRPFRQESGQWLDFTSGPGMAPGSC